MQGRGIVEIIAPRIPPEPTLVISPYPREMDTRGPEDLRQTNRYGNTRSASQCLGDIPGLYVDPSNSDIHMQGGGRGEHQFQLDGSIVLRTDPSGALWSL